jgi:hypothetical protein
VCPGLLIIPCTKSQSQKILVVKFRRPGRVQKINNWKFIDVSRGIRHLNREQLSFKDITKALKGTQQRLDVVKCSFPLRMGGNEIDGESRREMGCWVGLRRNLLNKPIDLITAVVDV